MSESTPKLLTVKETAALLTVGISTVWNLTRSGQLPNIKIADKVTRWEEAQVMQFIASKRSAQASDTR